MPNREGGYGGYRHKPEQRRQVRAPGSGSVRRMGPDETVSRPVDSGTGRAANPRPGAVPPDGRRDTPPRQVYRAPSNARRPAPENDGWLRPPSPPPGAPRRPAQPTPGQQAVRAAARRSRRNRQVRRRLTLLGTAACILLMAGVITAFLPKDDAAEQSPAADPSEGLTASLVAPLPYQAVTEENGGITTVQDWGNVGPVQQQEPYTYTGTPAAPSSVPAMGRVDMSWFDDAAFLGDSLTLGFTEFQINVGDALVCAYEGASPNQIADRTTMNGARGEEIPLDVLAAAQPKKLYVLLGANALAYQTDNDESFLNYYDRMLDELIAALPNTTIFVQSVLPVRAEAVADMPGLSQERVASINSALQAMAAEKGCLYLALNEAFMDENGSLVEEYAQPDGLHLTGPGYTAWVDYLCTHVPYDKDNPYQAGSEYYLTDDMRALLSDLP